MQETQFPSLGCEDPLEKPMATHSSIFAWKIPWTEEPGRLQYMVFVRQRVQHGHDWATNTFTFTFYVYFYAYMISCIACSYAHHCKMVWKSTQQNFSVITFKENGILRWLGEWNFLFCILYILSQICIILQCSFCIACFQSFWYVKCQISYKWLQLLKLLNIV